jgi:hypothetical protein
MKKKIFALALGAMLALSVVAPSLAFAGNYTDTAYQFNFSNGGSWLTASRAKQDDTSSYMKCTSAAGRSYNATVVARSGSTAYAVGSPSYGFFAGTERYLVNYVKERGYSYASILATPTSTASFAASGLWSPDSI